MGATSIYMATVAAQHRALVQHHHGHNKGHGPGADACCELLARRHLGLIPLFIAVQKAAMDAPKPAM